MDNFTFSYPTKVYFGERSAEQAFGAEMNAGAVITYEGKKWKGPILGTAPSFAVLDPAYTVTVPPMQVLSGTFDTLSHAMETCLCSSDQDNVSDDVALANWRGRRTDNAGNNSGERRGYMNRPYTVCHILSALDGKIAGAFMGTGDFPQSGQTGCPCDRSMRAGYTALLISHCTF